MPPFPHAIALVGFMGSGKSTVGAALARRLDLPFVDLDALLERRGPIPALFEAHGEAGFRALESEALRSVALPCVLATGGGTFLDPSNRVWLARNTTTVFIDTPLATCVQRVGSGTGRPLWSQVEDRFADRRPRYRTADHRVDGDEPAEAVVEGILRSLSDPSEHVEGPPAYPIHLADRLTDGLAEVVDGLESDRIVVITDDRVGPHWLDTVKTILGDVPTLTMPNGEANKTLGTWSDLIDGLLEARVSRRSLVVALGGGVVGDVAGFAASVVNRGVRVLQVPTTSLAMLDSSVGGKTAVNHPAGKNLVGTFHPPAAVFAATETLDTLDARNQRAGLSEAVKMALTHDPALFETIEAAGSALVWDRALFRAVLRQSVRIKAGVVARDLREAGERRLLNLGHTVGHALEAERGFGVVLHGEAVAIGLVAELRWSERHGTTEAGLADRAASVLAALGLPTTLPTDLDGARFRTALTLDKKARRDILDLPCVVRAGRSEVLSVDTDAYGHGILELQGQASS